MEMRLKRMVQQQSNEKNHHSTPIKTKSSSGTIAPMTSPTSQPSSPRPSNGNSPISPLSPGINTSSGSGNVTPGDSRIPRPSPTALRRSSSMRLRGERVSHHLRATGSFGSNTIQQYHHRHGHILPQQTDLFPAITENGLESPRHRSLVSFYF